ncbi:hypothetical protein COOONC_13265 [Cooperia oncophora]
MVRLNSTCFQQFLPHLSNADERAFVIVNKDGDYAIVKGRWTGFSRKQPASKGQKAKPGSAGRLLVDAFNLLKNTVQKIEVPSPEGSTLFVIGDAQARLPGKRIECRSKRIPQSKLPQSFVSPPCSCFAIQTRYVAIDLTSRYDRLFHRGS